MLIYKDKITRQYPVKQIVNNNYKCLITLLFIVNTFLCFGQNRQVVVEGRIIDSITKKPLAYVNIYTDNYQGTISNAAGTFALKVAPGTKTVSVSFLGYRKKEYAIKNIPKEIEMHPIPFKLKEVIIKPLDVNKLVTQIYNKYKSVVKQKSQEPASFFYRQTTLTDTTCNEILEAFFNANPVIGVNNLTLETGRYASLKDDSLNHYFTFTNFFIFSQITPFHEKKPKKKSVIVPLEPDFQKYYKVSVDILQNAVNSALTYRLNFVPLHGIKRAIAQGSIFIDPTNLLILKFEGEIVNMPLSLSNKNAFIKSNIIHFVALYDTLDGESRVMTVNIGDSFVYVSPSDIINIKISSILYHIGNQPAFNNKIKIQPKVFLLDKIAQSKYDAAFWSHNPIIKRTPLENKATKIFEKKNLFGTYKKDH